MPKMNPAKTTARASLNCLDKESPLVAQLYRWVLLPVSLLTLFVPIVRDCVDFDAGSAEKVGALGVTVVALWLFRPSFAMSVALYGVSAVATLVSVVTVLAVSPAPLPHLAGALIFNALPVASLTTMVYAGILAATAKPQPEQQNTPT